MTTTTTGRSPLASLALRIGETITIRTADGFDAIVRLTDVRMNYGKVQVQVEQGAFARWIDAEGRGIVSPRGWDKVNA